ncbi:hypothetical protein C3747_11g331 [Trypanosoma cruzi]|uniref:Uncharacterized protein n=2 Tax=Trypanosoma cruzi TaxID=5693 RepID=Q4E0C2_TRYCC|nr:hypothetical protein, conserved [Trypanosoma cruzi]EAN98235.1 hypothetical protein, conserved [Trypanosoma cruzi]PWV19191.1 hypothetical protein C3747_11g331 [Trypanosoma cruzi]RNC47804.1 hypothetical protein TcCL_NonESM02228 [Trypanosoma cruzi]|eukprot:XP_820086.1 hypothetical protein [Trypanosoma cruzi strain CL Brener]
MRSLRLNRLITVAALARSQSGSGSGRYQQREQQQQQQQQQQQRFGGPRDGRPLRGRPPQNFQQGGYRNSLNEPQLVAKLLELYPSGKSWMPINKWASSIPEEIQEALVAFGGLAQFTASQSNFFIVRKENGTVVVSLSTMASELCAKREKNIKKREEKAAAFSARRRDDSRRQRGRD